jgi:hypothetical protein
MWLLRIPGSLASHFPRRGQQASKEARAITSIAVWVRIGAILTERPRTQSGCDRADFGGVPPFHLGVYALPARRWLMPRTIAVNGSVIGD